MSQVEEELDKYIRELLARSKALVAELDRDYSTLCAKIQLHGDSIGPAEWATMVGAKAQLIVARIQVINDMYDSVERDPTAKLLAEKACLDSMAERRG